MNLIQTIGCHSGLASGNISGKTELADPDKLPGESSRPGLVTRGQRS